MDETRSACILKRKGSSDNSSSSDHDSQESSELENESSSSPESKDYPSEINQWNRSHIISLKLEPQFQDVNPLDLINRCSKAFSHDCSRSSIRKREIDHMEVRRKKIVSGFQEALSCISFVDSSYSELNAKSVSWVLQRFKTTDILWKMNKSLQEFKDQEPRWFSRFEVEAEKLCSYLYDVKKKEENGEKVTDDMYQIMFDTFAYMFGFYGGFGAPDGIHKRSMKVINTKVCGLPDILFRTREEDEDERKTILVAEVKQTAVEDPAQPDGPSLRKYSRISSSDSAVSSSSSQGVDMGFTDRCGFQLQDGTIGQHCAELILYYEDSLMNDAVLGVVVEKTKVIFTALSGNQKQIQDMLSGNLNLKKENRPLFIYTKQYDYLIQEDRNYLIDAFVKLGLIQMTREIF